MSTTKNMPLNWYSSMKKKIEKDSDNFWYRKLTLKVRILPFLTTFVQLSARLKNFLWGWLLVLGIKEGLVECATVCVKSVVILGFLWCSMGFDSSFIFPRSYNYISLNHLFWNKLWAALIYSWRSATRCSTISSLLLSLSSFFKSHNEFR